MFLSALADVRFGSLGDIPGVCAMSGNLPKAEMDQRGRYSLLRARNRLGFLEPAAVESCGLV
jgi:hypothetical protein